MLTITKLYRRRRDRCAECGKPFVAGDVRVVFDGSFYHVRDPLKRNCLDRAMHGMGSIFDPRLPKPYEVLRPGSTWPRDWS